MRGVTFEVEMLTPPVEFQLTRLMRGVTNNRQNLVCNVGISTHTPHARRDRAN